MQFIFFWFWSMRKYTFLYSCYFLFVFSFFSFNESLGCVEKKLSYMISFFFFLFFSTIEIGYQRKVNRSFHLVPHEQWFSLMENPCLVTPIRINITAVRDFSKQTYCAVVWTKKVLYFSLPLSLSSVVNKIWHLCQYWSFSHNSIW